MVKYVCKYIPVELIEGFNDPIESLNVQVDDFDRADSLIHRDVCAFSKAIIQIQVENMDHSTLVLTNCCDSLRRTSDVLKSNKQEVIMLDLPHQDNLCAKKMFQAELNRFIKTYENISGKKLDVHLFKKACNKRVTKPSVPYIALLGARASNELVDHISKILPLPLLNLTCSGDRTIGVPPDTNEVDDLIKWYSSELLNQMPCMRMTEISNRKTLINDNLLSGIIYNTVSFCDFYNFEYASLKRLSSIPILKIESDYTSQSLAQLNNRVSAFVETLNLQQNTSKMTHNFISKKFYVAGIDSGSTSTNVVIINQDRKIVSFYSVATGVDINKSASRALLSAMAPIQLSEDQLSFIVTTGYGRLSIEMSDKDVTEITCHAKGAYFLDKNIRTIIDIGGQDSKVIRLSEDGSVRDFAMNDKCAAGTGRFLEMMAQSLDVSLKEMSETGIKYNENIVISSMCSVFAQSEVVSLIASGKKLPDIVHGLYTSVVSRVMSLSARVGAEPGFMMTGGVAKNRGVIEAFKARLGSEINVPKNPDICGALGAALIAAEICDAKGIKSG